MKLASLLAAAGLLCGASVVRAQQGASACLDSIPASELHPTIVFLTSWRADSTSPAARAAEPFVDLYAQSVAQEVRALLGGKDGVLPRGEPRVTWTSRGGIGVVAYRDGRVSATVIRDSEPQYPPVDDRAPRLLAEAVDSLRARDERFVWPETLAGDSLVFRLNASYHVLERSLIGLVFAPRITFPVFTVGVPELTEVSSRPRQTGPRYPERLRQSRTNGTVLARFVVSAEGRYVPGTFRDVTAESMRLAAGLVGATQAEFARAVLNALPRMSFNPAKAGQCPIAQVVQQPFTFRIAEVPETTVEPPPFRRP